MWLTQFVLCGQSLVRRFGAGKIDAEVMLAETAKAKLKALRGSKSGARRKSLFDGAKALGTLLTQAVKRLERGGALMPAKLRSNARNLTHRIGELKIAVAALYTGAVE